MVSSRAGRHRVSLLLLLLVLLLPAACWAYQVVDIVEGKLAADESNQYTVDTYGVLVGMLRLAATSEQDVWLCECVSLALFICVSRSSCAAH